jgi:hypothetical protein
VSQSYDKNPVSSSVAWTLNGSDNANRGDLTLSNDTGVSGPVNFDGQHHLTYQQANAGTAGQYEVYSMDSTDEEGTDFGLECTTGGGCTDCAYGDFCDYSSTTLAIDADGDAGDEYIDSAAHGRIMWSYVAEGAVDFTSDSPGMLFTGANDDSECTHKGDAGPDDIFRAEWDSSSSAWDIVDDAGSPACPVSLGNGDDQHDPGVTPLPNGEFATFVRLGSGAYVYYWDPATSTWGDGAEFKICYDHATGDECGDPSTYCTEITADCIGNIDSLVTSVGSPNGGLFFLVKESGAPFAGGNCTDGVGSGKPEGILFADGQN